MARTRRAGRKARGKDGKPKMWIRCVCGRTLNVVDRPRYRDGRPKDPLWMIGGLSYTTSYNTNRGDKYEHDHHGKVHTHAFDCVYEGHAAPEVLEMPTAEELAAYAEEETLEELTGEEEPFRMSPFQKFRYEMYGEIPEVENEYRIHPALKANPSRLTEAGVTPRPRDVKRSGRRCGRHHRVTGQRILDHWNKLAGITEDMPHMEAKRREMEAYRKDVAAGKSWVMILDD